MWSFLNFFLINSNFIGKMTITFDELNLSESTLKAISDKNFKVATEIQAKVIPIIFEQKNDVVGIAQTGTGKTGAFGLPLVDMIETKNKVPQAIILAPTRELALQVTNEINLFLGKKRLKILTVYGGSPINSQISSLRSGVDIVVGTPGRVVDLIKRRELELNEVRYFILDEADEMLNMGFIEDVEMILEKSSKKRRVYLFSATMPERIKNLSKKYMKKQIIVEVEKKKNNTELIEQSFYKTRQSDKFDVLKILIEMENFFYGIVFCRTKADVDFVAGSLKKLRFEVDAIHGDIPQNRREKILKKFRDMQINILVATDVAARGIDVENLSHVINYNLPEDVETYTHRIGRTGRAGNKGKAISLTTPSEMRRINQIERELKVKIESKKLPSLNDINRIRNEKLFLEIEQVIESTKDEKYLEIAEKLLEKNSPQKIVSALLHKIHGSNLNKKSEKKNTDEVSRIFIAKGRFDGMDKKNLIKYIERETKLSLGNVDNVKVCDKFSFLTVNSGVAGEIVDFFEMKNNRRPLAEFAQK